MTVSYDPRHSHVVFSIALVILIVGGINWGVVAIRMLNGNRGQPQDMLSWAPWWVQTIVYFLVLSATVVVLGFWVPNKQCETCKCSPQVINIHKHPHHRLRASSTQAAVPAEEDVLEGVRLGSFLS